MNEKLIAFIFLLILLISLLSYGLYQSKYLEESELEIIEQIQEVIPDIIIPEISFTLPQIETKEELEEIVEDSIQLESSPFDDRIGKWYPLVLRFNQRIYNSTDNVALIGAMIEKESGGREDAVSPVGAVGLMQVMKPTWDELKAQSPHVRGSRRNPEANLYLGIRYIQRMQHPFRDFNRCEMNRRALASYNCGPGCVRQRIRIHEEHWFDHLPLETRNYLGILDLEKEYINKGWLGKLSC